MDEAEFKRLNKLLGFMSFGSATNWLPQCKLQEAQSKALQETATNAR
jgi:hypothetical protein